MIMCPLHLPQLLSIMHSCHPVSVSQRPNHVNYVCHEMYAFTNKNSWLMKFFKIVKKDEKMRCNERNIFSNSWLMKKTSVCRLKIPYMVTSDTLERQSVKSIPPPPYIPYFNVREWQKYALQNHIAILSGLTTNGIHYSINWLFSDFYERKYYINLLLSP